MIYIDAATLSLNGGVKPVEVYVPLAFEDGTAPSFNCYPSGSCFVQDGTSGATGSSATASQCKLFTLNSGWSASTKFAFESTFYVQSGYTGYIALWDMTTNSQVAGSQVSSTSTSATVVRSSQFTLTPGHTYGVTVWISQNTVNIYTYFVDASLIIFP